MPQRGKGEAGPRRPWLDDGRLSQRSASKRQAYFKSQVRGAAGTQVTLPDVLLRASTA